jgi:hypothetical protein
LYTVIRYKRKRIQTLRKRPALVIKNIKEALTAACTRVVGWLHAGDEDETTCNQRLVDNSLTGIYKVEYAIPTRVIALVFATIGFELVGTFFDPIAAAFRAVTAVGLLFASEDTIFSTFFYNLELE